MKFPEDFKKTSHPIVPSAIQYIGIKPNGQKISIIGGGQGLYGDGVTTFEMWDLDQEDPQGWMSEEDINKYLETI